MTIDWTKPIELTDGTPLHYVGLESGGMHVVRVIVPRPNVPGLRCVYDNGAVRGHGSEVVRNVGLKND